MSEDLSPTLLEITELPQLDKDSAHCEDSPDVNVNPPRDSECPNFNVEAGIAVCDKDDGTERTFQSSFVMMLNSL